MTSSDITTTRDGDPFAGSVLGGRYEVLNRLGQGGMALVYAALDRTLRRKVVIKIPRSEFLQVDGFRERFSREIGSLVELQHPNIVGIQDLGEHEGVPFAVLDYLSGGDLSQRIAAAGGVQSLEEVVNWLPSVAAGLDFIHERKTVHRDVKPQNIIFDQHGHAFLSDFGIATAMRAVESAASAQELTQLTQFGGFVGSAHFAPPEAIDRELSPAYDQYSLGVTVYRALTGELPTAPRSTPEATMAARAHEDPIPITRIQRGLPAAASRAIMRSLEREPTARFDNCTAFAAALSQAVLPRQRRSRSSRWNRTTTLALALAGALGLTGWFIASGLKDADESVAVPAPREVHRADATDTDHSDAVQRPVQEATTPEPQQPAKPQPLPEITVEPDPGENQPASVAEQPDPKTEPAATTLQEGMVRVAAGAFLSGCNTRVDRECGEGEASARRRNLAGYWIDATEVTVADYERCVTEGECIPPDTGDGCNGSATGRARHPVNCVDWNQARSYCSYAGKRLPSEWEWEKAARGTDGRKYAWGNGELSGRPMRANIADATLEREESGFALSNGYDDGYVRTAPVGSFPEGMSPVLALDMIGNVWEWTASQYEPASDQRVIRGGSWRDNATDARASVRLPSDPLQRQDSVGFRCVL